MANDDSTESTTPGPALRPGLARMAESLVYVVIVASLALAVTAGVTFVWGAAKVWAFIDLLLDEGSEASLAIVQLLEIIDIFLLGTVVVILAVGLIELFVTRLRLPAWLVITNLGDLKGKFIDVLQLVAAIKFLEIAVTDKDALDVLWYGIAVTLIIGVLLAVRVIKPAK